MIDGSVNLTISTALGLAPLSIYATIKSITPKSSQPSLAVSNRPVGSLRANID